jgi:hypothetical protein
MVLSPCSDRAITLLLEVINIAGLGRTWLSKEINPSHLILVMSYAIWYGQNKDGT